MKGHEGLSPERWAGFSLDQQILMIANEMDRASSLMVPADRDRLKSSYERALALTDLTIRVHERRSLRRELLRWRDLVAQLYVDDVVERKSHMDALRALLQFTPEASRQIPHVVDSPDRG